MSQTALPFLTTVVMHSPPHAYTDFSRLDCEMSNIIGIGINISSLCLVSRIAFSSAVIVSKTLLIAGSCIWNHPGVLVVAFSMPNRFPISLKTWSWYKLQMASDRFTLKLFDLHEQPLVIHQLFKSQVVSSCQCDQ